MAACYITIGIAAKGPVKKYVAVKEVVVPGGATMSMLVSKLCIPKELRVICLKDGKRMLPAAKLHDGDNVIMISMLPGG
jgi:hypothetical protein